MIRIGLKSYSVRSCPDICRHATIPCTPFWVIFLTDRQTDRQTDRHWQTHLPPPLSAVNNQLLTAKSTALLTFNGHYIRTAQQRTIIQQYGDWYTGRWWVDCYVWTVWYSEDRPGRTAALPSPLLFVRNVTAHPSTSSVPTMYQSVQHCNYFWFLKGSAESSCRSKTVNEWTTAADL